MRYTAVCRNCPLQVSVENQAALDELIDALDESDACRGGRHSLRQVLPP
jgi:hypothetical protein